MCSWLTKFLGVHWELRGKEHLEQERACIIVANHQSSLDVLGMFNIWPIMGKCTAVGKKEILYAWPFGLAAWFCGMIFIDRMNSEKAHSVINNATNYIKEKKVIQFMMQKFKKYIYNMYINNLWCCIYLFLLLLYIFYIDKIMDIS